MTNKKQVTKKSKKNNDDIAFYEMPITKLYILSIITFGIYDVYWFYRNFKVIQLVSKDKMYPFWRAIFVIFFIWSLFEKIKKSAQSKGYTKTLPVKSLAIAYVVILYIENRLLWINEYSTSISIAAMVFLLLGSLTLLPIQNAINFKNQNTKGKNEALNTKWEIVIIILGFVIFALAMIGYWMPSVTTNNQNSNPAINAEKTKMDGLTAEYNACSSTLIERRKTVDINSQETVDAYNNDFQNCENIRLEQNASVERYNKLIGQ